MIKQPAMQRRRDATQATKNAFEGKPFEWGKIDCARMVAFHLLQMGTPAQLGTVPPYDSAISAQSALQTMGVETLGDLIDLHFERRPPAAARLGDIVRLPGESAFDAICIVIGNGRVLGFHEEATGAVVLQPTVVPDAAWGINPT